VQGRVEDRGEALGSIGKHPVVREGMEDECRGL